MFFRTYSMLSFQSKIMLNLTIFKIQYHNSKYKRRYGSDRLFTILFPLQMKIQFGAHRQSVHFSLVLAWPIRHLARVKRLLKLLGSSERDIRSSELPNWIDPQSRC